LPLVEQRCLLVEEQGGFRAGRSTLDQIFSLHEIVASRRERNQRTYLAFLDCRHAYDRVWRSGLLYKLLQAGVNGRMFKMIQSMLQVNRRRILVQGATSEEFETSVGLPQGAVLSPLLYALFINGLAETLKEQHYGVWFGARQVGILLYADDIVLVAEDEKMLQAMLDCASAYASQWQFRFNTKPGKSDVVIAPHHEQLAKAAHFTLGDGPLTVSREYKYLGVEMGQVGQGCWNSYLHRIHRKATGAMNQLLYSVSGRSPLQMATCVHLFNTLVRPTLEYADAMWGAMCSKAGLQMLERVQEQFYRRLMRLPSSVAGEYIRAELGVQSMQERSACAALRFFGHLSRLCRQRHPDGSGPVRLVAYIFERRCAAVDNSAAELSWCHVMRTRLEEAKWDNIWFAKAVPDNWSNLVNKKMEEKFKKESMERMKDMSSLSDLVTVGPAADPTWIDRSRVHPGALLRLKLRCGALPLMVRVGASMKKPREQRLCLMCDAKAVEDTEHFLCQCSYFHETRERCLKQITSLIGNETAPLLRNALNCNTMKVFLGAKILDELPRGVAQSVDHAICNFLKVAWRRRDYIWKAVCVNSNPWRLPDG
jgi:hypothetical protein